jgi:hypothetical protein
MLQLSSAMAPAAAGRDVTATIIAANNKHQSLAGR